MVRFNILSWVTTFWTDGNTIILTLILNFILAEDLLCRIRVAYRGTDRDLGFLEGRQVSTVHCPATLNVLVLD